MRMLRYLTKYRGLGVNLQTEKAGSASCRRQSATGVETGIIKGADLTAVQKDGVLLADGADLVVIPRADWTRRLLVQNFLIGPIIVPVDGAGTMDSSAIGRAQLVDLDLKPEVVSDERCIVVPLRLG